MPDYYKFYPMDYLRSTLELGWYEDAALRRLIDLAWARKGQIPNDHRIIMRSIRAETPEHQRAAEEMLARFFELSDNSWRLRDGIGV